MVSQDEFDDIPSLGSARDDLDRPDIPTLKPASSPPQDNAPVATPTAPVKRSGTGLLWLLVVLLSVALAGAAYWFQLQMTGLQQQLSATEQALATSQSQLTDFETLISATDESANKSGAALQALLHRQLDEGRKRVSHVDSEIAKLWAVYQKYQPKITALEKQQQQQLKSLGSQKAELKTVGESLDTIGLSIDKQAQSVAKVSADLNRFNGVTKKAQQKSSARLEQFSEQLRDQDLANQEVDDLQSAQLKEIQDKLAQLSKAPEVPASVRQQLKEQQKALESVNSYRRQVNSELLKLRQRIGQLQRSVENAPKAVQ